MNQQCRHCYKAYEILRSLENMYPNAKISYGSEEIVIKETENG